MFRFKLLLFPVALSILASLASRCHSQEGLWDARIECPGGSIQFGLKIQHSQSDDKWSAWLVNGNEEIDVPKVEVAEDGELTLTIDHYDSLIVLKPVESTDIARLKMEGKWRKRRSPSKVSKMNVKVYQPVEAKNDNEPSKFDGRWEVKFDSSEEPAVGVFKTDAKTGKLLGTFLTTTGDYRFLSGTHKNNEMEISCFDGAHAFLFKASVNDSGAIDGNFWSSKTWHEKWTATRNENAKLADGFTLTKATEANINALSFPDLEGKQTRLDDKQFSAPVRLVHIFGSWCPNCHDAAVYLAELEAKHGKNISVVGIAFELTGDLNRDAEQVRKYLKRNKLDHPVLIGGGSSDKGEASKAVSIIDEVRSFPTTIFADKSGKIIAVHQGFSGPATGDAYVELKKKFESTIDGILDSEK